MYEVYDKRFLEVIRNYEAEENDIKITLYSRKYKIIIYPYDKVIDCYTSKNICFTVALSPENLIRVLCFHFEHCIGSRSANMIIEATTTRS